MVKQHRNGMKQVILITISLIALLALAPLMLRAQDSTCSYDRCALALHRSFLARHLVRGDSAVRVARIGFRAPALADFVARQDSAGLFIRQFRSDHTSGDWLLLVGMLTAVAGQFVVYESRQDAVGTGVAITGFALMVIGGERVRRGDNALQRAIWHYNRTLTR